MRRFQPLATMKCSSRPQGAASAPVISLSTGSAVELAVTPVRLGHEASGQVLDVGRNVVAVAVGDLVTSLSAPAYAENFVAAHHEIVKIPSGVDPMFALGEPIACCVHAANRFGIAPQDSVAIIGCGFMGLVCQQLAARQGAGLICAVDPIAERREMSRQLGAHIAYDPATVRGAEILALHGSFDVVIEAAGVQSALDLSTELVAEHGRIVLIRISSVAWGAARLSTCSSGTIRRSMWSTATCAAWTKRWKRCVRGWTYCSKINSFLNRWSPSTRSSRIADAFRNLDEQMPGLFKAVLKMA